MVLNLRTEGWGVVGVVKTVVLDKSSGSPKVFVVSPEVWCLPENL